MLLSTSPTRWSPLQQVFVAAASGTASHLCFYIYGEHHMKAPILFRSYVISFLVLLYGEVVVKDQGTFQGTADALMVSAAYTLALLTSIIIYRIFFHRLRKFPGPFMAGVTKLWHAANVLDSQNHTLLDGLYERYGDVVRTGPSEITIFTPEVKWAVDGPSNHCTKAVWYDILLPMIALNTTRSKKEHDQRRRIWDHAFTVKALEDYEKRIQKYGMLLEKYIASTSGEPVNVSIWFYFLSFDVMGDFAFAKSFKMLESKEWHYAVIMLRRALNLLGPLSSVPWLVQLAFSFPLIPVVRDWNRMISWCAEQMSERIDAKVDKPDVYKSTLIHPPDFCIDVDEQISSWLINGSKKNNTIEKDRNWLNGDSVALIVAGSDTVASTMVYLFYRLALDPQQAEKIRIELQSLPSICDAKALKSLNHLNGVINETLRLHPSVPTGGYRESPPQGIEIAGHFIPGHTTIVAPRYTMGRLEKSYERAGEFIPERWYSKPEMVADKKVFTPFSIGRFACVGKNLALSELRFVTALLVSKYDIAFAPGEDGVKVWKDMRDQFTAAPGKLELVFTARKSEQSLASPVQSME